RHEESAIRREHDAASGLAAEPFGRHGRLAPKDDFRVAYGILSFIEPGSRDVGIAVGAIDVIVKAEENLMVGCKVGIEHYVEQANARRPGGCHPAPPRQWLRKHAL